MDTIFVLFLLFYATWTAEANINVEGFEGGEVIFQCAHRFALNNNKYLCNNECKSKGDVLVTVKYGGTAQSGRITLMDLRNGAFTVNISQLQLSDSGRYWCGVDRAGFDTFTAVQLTVKTAVANGTPTVPPDVSSSWTNPNIFNTTHLIFEMNTSGPTNDSTTSNCTSSGEGHFSTSTALYTTMGIVSILIILVLATSFKKCRGISKPQPQVCSNSRVCVNAHEREISIEHNHTGGEGKSIKKSPKRTSSPQPQKLDPPPSESTAADTIPFHIYENISCFTGAAHPRHSAANVQTHHDVNSRIYIKPLPSIVFERTTDGSTRKPTRDNSATSDSDVNSTSSTELKPRSLWFGLDLSGTV